MSSNRNRYARRLLAVLLVILAGAVWNSQRVYRHMRSVQAVLDEAGDSCCSDPQKTVAILTPLLDREPDCLEARYMRAEAYGCLSQKAKERQDYLLAIRYAPRNPEAHYRLGEYYFIEKRYADAAKAMLDAVSLKRDYNDARVYLARSYESMGKRAEALKAYKDALEYEPDSLVILNGIRRLEAKQTAHQAP